MADVICCQQKSAGLTRVFKRGIMVGSSNQSGGSQAMNPRSPSAGGKGEFPHTDYFFRSGFGHWHGGNFWPYDGEDRSRYRNFYNLGREYRIEAARERA